MIHVLHNSTYLKFTLVIVRLSERMGDVGQGAVELFDPVKQNWKPACVTSRNSELAEEICSLLGYM
jgi:hypothetical protein